tara:strand:- start:872 stop:1072 length:201 start_codon:yes stop_codon:yes gene_type:complete
MLSKGLRKAGGNLWPLFASVVQRYFLVFRTIHTSQVINLREILVAGMAPFSEYTYYFEALVVALRG